MAAYATLDDLRPVAAAYEVAIDSDDAATRALELASHDLDLHLVGTGTLDPDTLTDDQLAALADACAIQATFRLSQGPLMLGEDDGLASAGPVTFTLRPLTRLSPEAADRISGLAMLRRSGCAPPPPAAA